MYFVRGSYHGPTTSVHQVFHPLPPIFSSSYVWICLGSVLVKTSLTWKGIWKSEFNSKFSFSLSLTWTNGCGTSSQTIPIQHWRGIDHQDIRELICVYIRYVIDDRERQGESRKKNSEHCTEHQQRCSGSKDVGPHAVTRTSSPDCMSWKRDGGLTQNESLYQKGMTPTSCWRLLYIGNCIFVWVVTLTSVYRYKEEIFIYSTDCIPAPGVINLNESELFGFADYR